MKKILNADLRFIYVVSSVPDFSSWETRIQQTLENGYPIILDIDTRYVSWPYSSDGHIIPVSDMDVFMMYSEDVSSRDGDVHDVKVTDPYNKNGALGNKWYNSNTLYTANRNHFRQEMIW